jgi:signal transduction histidine kinase
VNRLSKLAADLRRLADLETQPLERAVVDLNELLSEAVALARERPEGEEREIALTLPQAP